MLICHKKIFGFLIFFLMIAVASQIQVRYIRFYFSKNSIIYEILVSCRELLECNLKLQLSEPYTFMRVDDLKCTTNYHLLTTSLITCFCFCLYRTLQSIHFIFKPIIFWCLKLLLSMIILIEFPIEIGEHVVSLLILEIRLVFWLYGLLFYILRFVLMNALSIFGSNQCKDNELFLS